MPISEILSNIALGFGIFFFAGMSFWTMYALDKDDHKKRKRKTKKA